MWPSAFSWKARQAGGASSTSSRWVAKQPGYLLDTVVTGEP